MNRNYDLMVGSIDFEIYHGEAQVGQNELEAMGWSEAGLYKDNGDFSAEAGQLVLRKTSPAVSGDTSPAYEVSKIFTDRLEGYGGDSRVTM